MTVFFIILGALVAVGLPLFIHHRLTGNRGVASDSTDTAADVVVPDVCCGQHAVCERDSLLAAVSRDIEYFDDEELDLYRGRSPESYSPAEEEQFREVLLTLLPADVAPWARSMQLRGIELPVAVRDELLLIIGEQRTAKKSS